MKDFINDKIFSFRYWLMPREFKSGTWLTWDGDFINLGEIWRKSRKKGVWFLPRIEWRSPSQKKIMEEMVEEK